MMRKSLLLSLSELLIIGMLSAPKMSLQNTHPAFWSDGDGGDLDPRSSFGRLEMFT